MKNKWAVTGIVFVLLISMAITFPTCTKAQVTSVPKIGVYYYPWYVGNWSIYHKNCPDTPVLGQYDSSNLSVIVQHLNWFEQLGINFVIFSWWGKYSPSDNNTDLILSQIAKNYTNIQFFIMVEPFGRGWNEAYNASTGAYNFTLIYNYIYDTYVTKFGSNCFNLNGNPVIGFYDDASKNLTRNGIPVDSRFTLRLIGCQSNDDWEYQVPDPSLSAQPVCRDGEISVSPRYDANGWYEDVNYTQGLYDQQWIKAINEAKQGKVDIITIISWNEFAERTQIEPAWDTTSAFKDNPFYLFNKTENYIKSLSEPFTVVDNAVDFLVHSQFNQTLGLCHEAPNVAPNSYWLVSDNLWAWKALSMENESGLSNAAEAGVTAGKIKAKLADLSVNYNMPTDSNGLPEGYAHEAVIGDPVPPPYKTETNCTLYNGDYVLNTTMHNGTVMLDWDQYADLLLYAALSCHWQGNNSGAFGYFNNAAKMWNETSKGLQDKAFNGTYDTYKLALLLYTSKVIGENLTFESELINKIYEQQNQSNGGIVTGYYSNGTLVGDANTETTSIVIIALLTPTSSIQEFPSWIVLPVLLIMTLLVTVAIRRKSAYLT